MAQNSTPAKRPQIAVVANIYKTHLHTQHIIDRILEGYGWGGAFYYWNTPYQTDANGNTVTVGQAILSDPVQYEKFVATNAKALSDTLGFDQASGGISAVIKDL